MTEEINLSSIINRIVEKKIILIGIIGLSFIISLIYAFNKDETYKAEAYLIPPENRYVQPLNIFLDDGYRLSRDEITPSVIYRTFMLNLQSRKYQKKYFDDNKLDQYFDEQDPEKSFIDNFYKNINFVLESKITSRDFREQQFLTVSFIHTNPEQAAVWLNQYIKMVSDITAKDFVDGVNILILNTKKTFESEILGKKNLEKRITQDRITQLEEALLIAKDLGITDRESGVSNQQSVVLSDDESIHSKNPIYLYGTKALMAEIKALKSRSNTDAFIIGLRQLEQKVKSLETISVNISDVRSAQLDQAATTPKERHAPNRKLITLLGTILGGFFAFTYLIFSFIFSRK